MILFLLDYSGLQFFSFSLKNELCSFTMLDYSHFEEQSLKVKIQEIQSRRHKKDTTVDVSIDFR